MEGFIEESVRERLIIAGIEELRERGVQNFSLRRAALSAQVSCAAPYRHFKDKNEYDFQSVLLQHLCWQILYAFTLFKTNNQIKKLHEKIVLYRPDITNLKMSLFHKVCLTIFMKFPQFYVFLRKIIPFHIRRNS